MKMSENKLLKPAESFTVGRTQEDVENATQGLCNSNRRSREGLVRSGGFFFFFLQTLKNTRDLMVSTERDAGKGCLEAN